jgi:hypothetical protein
MPGGNCGVSVRVRQREQRLTGHSTLELTWFFGAVGRDPVRSYSEIITTMSIGLGDDAAATSRSLSIARRRAVRADRAAAASAQ